MVIEGDKRRDPKNSDEKRSILNIVVTEKQTGTDHPEKKLPAAGFGKRRRIYLLDDFKRKMEKCDQKGANWVGSEIDRPSQGSCRQAEHLSLIHI